MIRNRGQRWVKRIIILLVVLMVLALGVLVGGYLMITYRPDDYNPEPLTKLHQDQVEKICTRDYIQDFHNNVVLKQPFSINYKQDLLNGVLMFDDQMLKQFLWPGSHESYDQFSRKFYQPQLSFKDGAVYIMGQVVHEGVVAVLTIGFQIKIVEGHRVKVTMLPVKVGAGKVPQSIIDKYHQKIIGRMANRIEKYKSLKEKDLEGQLPKRLTLGVPELLEKNEFIVDSLFHVDNDVQAEIAGIEIKDGQMRVDFWPTARDIK